MVRKTLSAVAAVLTVLLALSSLAGEKPRDKPPDTSASKSVKCYKLISGFGDKMCRLFEENLNQFCDEPPMVCERKIAPEFAKDFSFPDWEPVEPKEHMDLIADYVRARAPRNALCAEGDEQCQAKWREGKWQEYKTQLLERMKSGEVELSRAVIHIFNKERAVYRLIDYPCSPYSEICWISPQVPKLFAADLKDGGFDKEFTSIAPRAPADILLYKGGACISAWEGRSPVLVSGTVRIERWSSIACMFEYIAKKGMKR